MQLLKLLQTSQEPYFDFKLSLSILLKMKNKIFFRKTYKWLLLKPINGWLLLNLFDHKR